MRTLTLAAMTLACALLFGLVLYLRLNGGDPALRLALLAATVVMAVLMLLHVGHSGGRRSS